VSPPVLGLGSPECWLRQPGAASRKVPRGVTWDDAGACSVTVQITAFMLRGFKYEGIGYQVRGIL